MKQKASGRAWGVMLRALGVWVAVVFGCRLVLVGWGCGGQSAGVPPEIAEGRPPVIGHLEMRNEVVTIMSGYGGPVYTITAEDGGILAEQLSEQEMKAISPRIYRLLKSSYAGGRKATPIWAGL